MWIQWGFSVREKSPGCNGYLPRVLSHNNRKIEFLIISGVEVTYVSLSIS